MSIPSNSNFPQEFPRDILYARPNKCAQIMSKFEGLFRFIFGQPSKEENPVEAPKVEEKTARPVVRERVRVYPSRKTLPEKIASLDNPIPRDERIKIYSCGIHIITNEAGFERLVKVYQERPKLPNSCHIGFSGWHNFDIMALRKSEIGIIIDLNYNNKKFIDHSIQMLKECKTRYQFVKAMVKYVKQVEKENIQRIMRKEKFDYNFSETFDIAHETVADQVKSQLDQMWGWLSSDERYHYIKSLAEKGRIIAFTENIMNTETFEKLGRILGSDKIAIDTLYLSNVLPSAEADELMKQFQGSVRAMTQENTLVIHSTILRKVNDSIRDRKQREMLAAKGYLNNLVQDTLEGKDVLEDPGKLLNKEVYTVPIQ